MKRLAAAIVVFVLAGAAAAQGDYPSRAVRIVVPFPPGGPTDLYARLIGQQLQEAWRQPVVVENRPGGTGLVGSTVVQQAAADAERHAPARGHDDARRPDLDVQLHCLSGKQFLQLVVRVPRSVRQTPRRVQFSV